VYRVFQDQHLHQSIIEGILRTCTLHRTWCSWCRDRGSPNRISPAHRQSTSRLDRRGGQCGDKMGTSTVASEVTYLSLVADYARARHGGDRMVERWQVWGSKAEASPLCFSETPNSVSSRLLSSRGFAMMLILNISIHHHGGIKSGID
jgi:hypothetical protein